mgnify:FL=1
MLFSSITFLYAFLPAVLFFYFIAADKYRNAILLISSIIFYAWGEPKYLLVMLCIIFANYLAALQLQKTKKIKHIILIGTICLNLCILGYFKYFNFFVENLNNILNLKISIINIVMPLGISFYTFQALSYVIDVYRGEVKAQKDLMKVALYIALFPQLIAGPIVKYHDIEQSICNKRVITSALFVEGIKRFLCGLGKKVLIANNMGLVADKIFNMAPEQVDTPLAWIGAICYSLQIFFDFSGYSDMAIGLGLLFGFRFQENFNYPYIADSITEFWHRWHISLSTWLKNYLYIPLGGNRKGLAQTCMNLLIVFAVTGFWHGAEWTFIAWGLWHGLFIVIEKVTGWHKKRGNAVFITFKHVLTLFIVLIGWVLFRSKDLNSAYHYLKNMFGLLPHSNEIFYTHTFYYDNIQIMAALFGILFSTPLIAKFFNRGESSELVKFCQNLSLIAIMILSSAFLTADTYNPFIYFRF